MMLPGVALTLALVLVAAQGSRPATKRKKAPPPAAAVEKRAAPGAHAERRATEQRPAARKITERKVTERKVTGKASERRPSPGRGEPDAVRPAPPDHSEATEGAGGDGQAALTTVKPSKTKVYSFGAMDVEGRLKTPQLLYFLNRIKLELEMSAPDHRSFMKELEKTADDPNL